MSQNLTPSLDPINAPETVRVIASAAQDSAPGTVALVDPTQVRRPLRTTVRTLFQALVALAVLFPVLVAETGLKAEDYPWLGIALAVAAVVTRIMANPKVEVFLRTFLPFLSAAPK